jgi:predicted O-methyltransferase YrrM
MKTITGIAILLSFAAGLDAQRPFGRMRGGPGGSALGNTPLAKDDAEKRILDAAAQVDRVMSVPPEDGRMIRLLTEAIGAKHAVEIGSSTGYSGLWFALALRRTGGRLTTHELDPGAAAAARENYRKAGVDGIITLVEGDAHETIKRLSGPIDIVFIDADKEGYRDYVVKLLPLLRPGGLILAHNVGSRGENPEYVEAVTKNPHLETLLLTSQMTVTLRKR